MSRTKHSAGNALYLTWKIGEASPPDVGSVLRKGENERLFRLRSWGVCGLEARALLTPRASLEKIVDAIWVGDSVPTASRWVRRGAECAELTRQMENAPVS